MVLWKREVLGVVSGEMFGHRSELYGQPFSRRTPENV
jgi:hypothetical protein